jgi:hypothetical protein
MLLGGVDGVDGLTRRHIGDSPLNARLRHAYVLT